MFGFLKRYALATTCRDLNNCLNYLEKEIDTQSRELVAAQLINTIIHHVNLIADGKATAGNISQYFTKNKNEFLFSKGLQDHRDIEFSAAYILRCFFFCLHNSSWVDSKYEALKIINFSEKFVAEKFRSSADIQKIFHSLRSLFYSAEENERLQRESKPPTPAVAEKQYPNDKKWEWKNGVLTNRVTGRSFNAQQAVRDNGMHCFEFADNLPHIRVYDHEIDFIGGAALARSETNGVIDAEDENEKRDRLQRESEKKAKELEIENAAAEERRKLAEAKAADERAWPEKLKAELIKREEQQRIAKAAANEERGKLAEAKAAEKNKERAERWEQELKAAEEKNAEARALAGEQTRTLAEEGNQGPISVPGNSPYPMAARPEDRASQEEQERIAKAAAEDSKRRAIVEDKKWYWKNDVLKNRLSGRSYDATQVRRNDELECFEVAEGMPDKGRRIYFNLVDFGERSEIQNGALNKPPTQDPLSIVAQKQPTEVAAAKLDPKDIKWEWRNGLLTNRRTGLSFNARQAWWDVDMHCFEFADGMPHIRVYDHEIDFGVSLYKCVKCHAPLYMAKGRTQTCVECGQMNKLPNLVYDVRRK